MDQEREDYADAESPCRPLASGRAHGLFALAAVLYPVGCLLLMGCTWEWFLGDSSGRLVFNVGVVPALAVAGVVALRLTAVRLHWAAVAAFAVWAAMTALLTGWLIAAVYASV